MFGEFLKTRSTPPPPRPHASMTPGADASGRGGAWVARESTASAFSPSFKLSAPDETTWSPLVEPAADEHLGRRLVDDRHLALVHRAVGRARTRRRRPLRMSAAAGTGTTFGTRALTSRSESPGLAAASSTSSTVTVPPSTPGHAPRDRRAAGRRLQRDRRARLHRRRVGRRQLELGEAALVGELHHRRPRLDVGAGGHHRPARP